MVIFKRNIIVIMLISVLLSVLTLTPVYAAEDTPSIMVIHSYDLSYQWTKKQDEGIRKVLLDAYPKANIYTEVLDAKRFDSDYILSNQLGLFSDKYSKVDLDLILVTDDLGLEFALEARQVMGIDIPIAFSGILKEKIDDYPQELSNVTGVYEIRGFTRMISLMETLQPNADKVVIINDTSSSSKQMVEKVLMGFEALNLTSEYEIEYWEEKAYDDILEDVQSLDETTALYLISYHKSYDGVIKTGQIFCNEISEASTVPMYSLGELYFGSGLTGGEFLSGNLQGEALAEIALRLLAGEEADSIPYSDKSTSYLGVDENMTRKYGLEQIVLPEDTRILNEQFTFYEQYKTLVLAVMTAFVVLVAFIMVLLRQGRTINQNNQALKSQKYELQKLYDQVSTSEEELTAQNEELLFYQDKLQYEADHDYLTGLWNRSMQERAVGTFINSDVLKNKHLMCIFVDLDNFKFINNSMGHHAGDIILKEVAKKISGLEGTLSVARVGGDEFVVIYECNNKSHCSSMVASVTDSLKKIFTLPIRVGTELISVSASMGCSLYPDDAITYDSLIICADLAMYEAKKNHRGKMVIFDEKIEEASDRDFQLGKEINRGIEENEFYLAYQPLMTADGSCVKSLEALLRWESSVFGSVSPGEFIHAAEVGGYMIDLGSKVIDMALEFVARNKENLGSVNQISINISVLQFYQEDFIGYLMSKLDQHMIEPSWIQLEIVESMMIHSYDMIYEKLVELRHLGIAVALDDFGTGYSSLAHLNELPVDTLKIDKHFVDHVTSDSPRNMIIEAIVVLAKNLSLKTVAEGVEDQLQMAYIKDCGIDFIQGYYYSRPLIEKDVLNFIASKN